MVGLARVSSEIIDSIVAYRALWAATSLLCHIVYTDSSDISPSQEDAPGGVDVRKVKTVSLFRPSLQRETSVD